MHCPLTMHIETQVLPRIWMTKYFWKRSSVTFEVVICYKVHSCCWMVYWGSSVCNITSLRSVCVYLNIHIYTTYVYVFMTEDRYDQEQGICIMVSILGIYISYHTFCATAVPRIQVHLFDVEYIYGFVGWGVCMQSRWRHSVTEPHTRWRIYVTMATLWQQQDGGYAFSTSSTVQS